MTKSTRNRADQGALTVRELSKATWDDFEDVLGNNGGARGCWCMHWRLSIDEFMAAKGDGNKRAMKKLAARKSVPGVVVYRGTTPVAWCSLGERASFPRLQRSALLASIDDKPVCAITCILVQKKHRGSGLCRRFSTPSASTRPRTATRTPRATPSNPATAGAPVRTPP